MIRLSQLQTAVSFPFPVDLHIRLLPRPHLDLVTIALNLTVPFLLCRRTSILSLLLSAVVVVALAGSPILRTERGSVGWFLWQPRNHIDLILQLRFGMVQSNGSFKAPSEKFSGNDFCSSLAFKY
jgi:hypothetical protein